MPWQQHRAGEVMQRLWIAAQAVKRDDVVLTNDARCEQHYVYADVAIMSADVDDDQRWVYVTTDNDRFRFAYDQQVTVLRGI